MYTDPDVYEVSVQEGWVQPVPDWYRIIRLGKWWGAASPAEVEEWTMIDVLRCEAVMGAEMDREEMLEAKRKKRH